MQRDQAYYAAKLRAFYTLRQPEKLQYVDVLMKEHAGREGPMFHLLDQTYPDCSGWGLIRDALLAGVGTDMVEAIDEKIAAWWRGKTAEGQMGVHDVTGVFHGLWDDAGGLWPEKEGLQAYLLIRRELLCLYREYFADDKYMMLAESLSDVLESVRGEKEHALQELITQKTLEWAAEFLTARGVSEGVDHAAIEAKNSLECEIYKGSLVRQHAPMYYREFAVWSPQLPDFGCFRAAALEYLSIKAPDLVAQPEIQQSLRNLELSQMTLIDSLVGRYEPAIAEDYLGRLKEAAASAPVYFPTWCNSFYPDTLRTDPAAQRPELVLHTPLTRKVPRPWHPDAAALLSELAAAGAGPAAAGDAGEATPAAPPPPPPPPPVAVKPVASDLTGVELNERLRLTDQRWTYRRAVVDQFLKPPEQSAPGTPTGGDGGDRTATTQMHESMAIGAPPGAGQSIDAPPDPPQPEVWCLLRGASMQQLYTADGRIDYDGDKLEPLASRRPTRRLPKTLRKPFEPSDDPVPGVEDMTAFQRTPARKARALCTSCSERCASTLLWGPWQPPQDPQAPTYQTFEGITEEHAADAIKKGFMQCCVKKYPMQLRDRQWEPRYVVVTRSGIHWYLDDSEKSLQKPLNSIPVTRELITLLVDPTEEEYPMKFVHKDRNKYHVIGLICKRPDKHFWMRASKSGPGGDEDPGEQWANFFRKALFRKVVDPHDVMMDSLWCAREAALRAELARVVDDVGDAMDLARGEQRDLAGVATAYLAVSAERQWRVNAGKAVETAIGEVRQRVIALNRAKEGLQRELVAAHTAHVSTKEIARSAEEARNASATALDTLNAKLAADEERVRARLERAKRERDDALAETSRIQAKLDAMLPNCPDLQLAHASSPSTRMPFFRASVEPARCFMIGDRR